MPTYTPNGSLIDELTPFRTTVSRAPTDDDLPTVTVHAKFDWQFWLGIAAGIGAAIILAKSLRKASRLSTRKRVSRRMR